MVRKPHAKRAPQSSVFLCYAPKCHMHLGSILALLRQHPSHATCFSLVSSRLSISLAPPHVTSLFTLFFFFTKRISLLLRLLLLPLLLSSICSFLTSPSPFPPSFQTQRLSSSPITTHHSATTSHDFTTGPLATPFRSCMQLVTSPAIVVQMNDSTKEREASGLLLHYTYLYRPLLH